MSDWIEWNGGECPVGHGNPVEVIFREGMPRPSKLAYNPSCLRWEHTQTSYDIVAYRSLRPREEPTELSIEELLTQANYHAAKAAEHERKRASLIEEVTKRIPEGFVLTESLGKTFVEYEDMTDPFNWKVGDVVECLRTCRTSNGISANEYTKFSEGAHYIVDSEVWEYGFGVNYVFLKSGDYETRREMSTKYLKWVSRPSKETN